MNCYAYKCPFAGSKRIFSHYHGCDFDFCDHHLERFIKEFTPVRGEQPPQKASGPRFERADTEPLSWMHDFNGAD